MGFFGGGGGTTPVNMVGASTGTAGTAGYVPAPAAGKNTRYLSSDASFGEVPLYPQFKAANTNWIAGVISGCGQAYGSTNPATRRRQFGLGFLSADGNIATLGYRLVTAPAASINIHVALWDVNEDGTVGAYIIGGVGASGTTGNTDISVSVTSTPMKRGFYYYSLTQETSGGSIRGYTPSEGGLTSGFIGRGAGAANAANHPYYVATTYDQTTHGTFLYDVTAVPQVVLKYA